MNKINKFRKKLSYKRKSIRRKNRRKSITGKKSKKNIKKKASAKKRRVRKNKKTKRKKGGAGKRKRDEMSIDEPSTEAIRMDGVETPPPEILAGIGDHEIYNLTSREPKAQRGLSEHEFNITKQKELEKVEKEQLP